jgi:hypothetical protein
MEYFENNLEKTLCTLEQCDKKNYGQISDLLFKINSDLEQYLLDFERFRYVWLNMWVACYQSTFIATIKQPAFNALLDKNPMQTIMERIFQVLVQLNTLKRKKIIYKKELSRIEDIDIQLAFVTIKNLHKYINSLIKSDKNDYEITTKYLFYIDCKLQDRSCKIEGVKDALSKVAEAYRKADENR